MGWFDIVRGFAGGERDLARRAGDEVDRRLAQRRERKEQLLAPEGTDAIFLGRQLSRDDRWDWFSLDVDRLTAMHASISGASGSGKTRWIEAIVSQLLRVKHLSCIIVDAKSEFSDDLLDVVVPAYVVATKDVSILDRIRVLRPFGSVTPPLNVTLPEPGVVREAQALGITSAIEETLDERFGARMRITMPQLISCAIALGRPLPAILDWLLDPHLLLKEIIRCPDGELREFARTGLPRESAETLHALAARMRAMLFLPATRRALSTSTCISFTDILEEPGALTVIDVGSPPAGSERLTKFWGSLLNGRVTRAILSRHVTPSSPRVLAVFEEIQEIITKSDALSLARLLSLARFRGAAIWTSNQARAQITAVDRNLDQALRTNAGAHIVFRSSIEDARSVAHLLPHRKSKTGVGSGTRGRAEMLTRLKQREFLLALRSENQTLALRSPRFDLDALRREADTLDPDVRERIRRGVAVGEPLTERVAVPAPLFNPREDDRDEESGIFPALG